MAERIAKRYQINGELGAGGMGTVYLGEDTQTNLPVAIKQLKPELLTENLLERFQREGQALRDLNHPNMVKMLDAVEENGHHYLIMEYVSGGDLKQLIEQGELSIQQILQIAIDLADALTRAHRLDIIHRDLKPANVLIAEDGTPRLTDFGVAYMADKERVTGTNAIVGTIDYLAPEIFQGSNAGNRTDIWAFGILLFEMLTGERPFVGNTITQTIYQIVNEQVPDLEELRSDAPIALVDLVYRMLEKDLNQRVPSIRHVGTELEDVLQGRSKHTPPESRFETPIPDVFVRAKHNLPSQVTEFVGRESELAELAKLLADPKLRLITILAPGGMGKTRLSLEAAKQQLDNFKDGVYFVELAPLREVASIIPVIAEAVDYQFQSDGREQKQQILHFLANKNLLLVMDNYEHLMDGASLVTDILNAAPDVQILATSRKRLEQAGETLFHLSGMEFPQWETPEDAMDYAAVKLFMQSAKQARSDFELTHVNLDYVARICRLVAGMPLGIVLAAAWLGLLSIEEVAQELQQGIDFLETEGGDIPARQKSIRVVFDYSWQMMREPEQDVFMKLSVFRGGFTRQAAQEITEANLRTLMNLVNKSLIRRDADSGRYEIHELLRQYAEEQLEKASLDDEALDKHSHYYLTALAERETDLAGRNQITALNNIDSDLENVRTAWGRAVSQKNAELINHALESLAMFCTIRDQSLVGASLLMQALQVFNPIEYEQLWGRIISRMFFLQSLLSGGEKLSRKELEQALDIAQKHKDEFEIVYCYGAVTRLLVDDFDFKGALSYLKDNLEKLEALENHYMQSGALQMIAFCYIHLGNVEQFVQFNRRNIELARTQGNFYHMISSMNNLAWYAVLHGDISDAETLAQEVISVSERLGNRMQVSSMQLILSLLAFFRGDFSQALELTNNVVQVGQEMDNLYLISYAFACQSLANFGLGNYEQGLSDTETAWENHPNQTGQYIVHLGTALNLIALNDYEQARHHCWKFVQIATLSLQIDEDCIHILPIFAILLSQRGKDQRAAEILALSYEHPVAYQGWQDKAPLLLRFRERLKTELGDHAYQVAYERGQSLDLEIVAKEILDEFSEDES